MKQPRTLMEAVRYFADADRTQETAVALRWPNGIHCPTCGRVDVRYISTRRLWECKEKHAKRQFSAKVGTIFEDSPLPLDKWFVAIWAIANCKNGISSYELARAIGVTQKTGWHMLHRIRLAMEVGGPDKFGGIVEADETFIGGDSKNMHAAKRKSRVSGRGPYSGDKVVVMGILERTSEDGPSRVHARPIRDANAKTLRKVIREIVTPGAKLHTDAHLGYRGLSAEYVHEVINHAVAYVQGTVHTNGIECFWSLLKRGLKGTYVSVNPVHLHRYVAEQARRFNERKGGDYDRFASVVSSIIGKRLTWKDLTDHAQSPAFG